MSIADNTAERDSELRRLQQELAQVTAQLEKLQQHKSNLMAVAVHDLRTPLSIIQGYSQLLAADLMPEADVNTREYILNIVVYADSLGNMVENLIALDQLERGEFRLSIKPCDLNELIGQALAQVEGLMMVKNLRKQCTLPPASIQVKVDELRVGRVLYNLLSHAAKYAHPDSELRIDINRDGGFGRVMVIDPQRTLSPALLARLFDLVEVSENVSGSPQSMDMGLVLAHHVVREHGGRLEASCEPGRGVTLTLYLPIAND